MVSRNNFLMRAIYQTNLLDVFRVDRDLSAAAGGVDDQLWDGIACRVAAERADDIDTLLDRRAEMGRAFNQVAGVAGRQVSAPGDHFLGPSNSFLGPPDASLTPPRIS